MLAETRASPPTLPFAGEGADRKSVDVNARSNNSFPWQQGKDGMGPIFACIAPIPTFPRSRGKEWNGDYEITSHSIRSVTLGINHVETI